MSPRRAPSVPVAVEIGSRRTFAIALGWPGWARSGRDEPAALAALAAAASRYASVAGAARVRFPPGRAVDVRQLRIVERLAGDGGTDFGVPHAIAGHDRRAMTPSETTRELALLRAAWRTFDRVVEHAPPELTKGPRGGGRDRDAVVAHVLDAEAAYGRAIGIRLPTPSAEPASLRAHRRALADALRSGAGTLPDDPKRWPARYAVRRIAWHVLDHAWEIEDRSPTA